MKDPPKGAAERAIHLLRLVGEGPHHFTLGELAGRARLPVSSVHRLLQPLMASGLVERGPSQTYCIGRELYRFASGISGNFDIAAAARPMLASLVGKWHETAVFCVYRPMERRAIIQEAIQSPQPLRFSVEPGGDIELAWGSLGRAILAHLPESEIEAIYRSTGEGPLTGRPRTGRQVLLRELAKVRKQGLARYFDPGLQIAGFAAPVFSAEREILGSIGILMPSSRCKYVGDAMEADIISATKRLSLTTS